MILAGDLIGFHVNERSTMQDTAEPTILVPLAPIEAHIERIGGLANLPGTGIYREKEIDRPPYRRVVIHRTLEEQRKYRGAKKLLARMREQGRLNGGMVDLGKADAFCCTFLSVHPMEVFGMAWFTFEPEVRAEVDEAVVA